MYTTLYTTNCCFNELAVNTKHSVCPKYSNSLTLRHFLLSPLLSLLSLSSLTIAHIYLCFSLHTSSSTSTHLTLYSHKYSVLSLSIHSIGISNGSATSRLHFARPFTALAFAFALPLDITTYGWLSFP